MKTPFTNTSTSCRTRLRSMTQVFFLSAIFSLLAVAARAQTPTPVFTNLWVVVAGAYPDLAADANNLVRGIAINPVTTNVLYASRGAGSNHVSVVSYASGSNYLAALNALTISAGTLAMEGVRVADDGAVYASNLSGAPGSRFLIFKWADETAGVDPVVVYDSGQGTSFQWRAGDYMDVRGGGIDTEIVVVGNGSGANITTNFVVFRPTDASCTTFTNFTITIPGGVNNLCGAGVAFEGSTNAIWIRQAGSQLTRRVAYDPTNLTAIVTRTNNVDQSVCQGLKYYSASGVQMLATVQPSSALGGTQIARVFTIPAALTGFFGSVLSSNIPVVSTSQNGNGLGNVDARKGCFVFGAPGNGLSFFRVGFITNSPPGVLVAASASTIIAGYPATFTATASGSTPLSYQWFFNTNTLLPSVTNFYSLPSIQTGDAGLYTVIVTNLYGAATNSATISVLPNGSSSMTTQFWSLAPGSRDYLTTTDTQRGLAYDPMLNRLVLVSRSLTNGIHLLDAATGADAGVLDISALLAITPPGAYAVNMCGVADDGIVYVGNLLTSAVSDNYAIYSWTSADPAGSIGQAYAGNPGIGRIGDTMAVRGAGVNTEILCSFRTGTNVAVFNTSDGVNFNFNLIAITNLPADAQANGFAGLGLAFGSGNTFWAKSSGFNLRHVAYDVANGVGGVIDSYPLPISETVIGVDNTNGYVAEIGIGQSPQNLAIYDLFAPGGPSLGSLVDREFYPVNNANANGTGAVAFDVAGGRIFALDSNNGIIALSYAGKVAIAQSAGKQVVSWPTSASSLQSSTNVTGPYTTVSGATSPYTNSTSGTKFFRLSK